MPHPALLAGPIPAAAGDDGYALATQDRALALLLFTTWAARTGRILRAVPVSELSPEELMNFWADDQLEQPLETPVHQWTLRR